LLSSTTTLIGSLVRDWRARQLVRAGCRSSIGQQTSITAASQSAEVMCGNQPGRISTRATSRETDEGLAT